ncbi:MAG: HlyC/CorC family transporter [Pseudohongiella sp.]|nr:MAG: HlyC/CorC family transporter [Pseudohongiella sp.]
MAVWLGIVFCLSQSAMFSGLNLAFFGLSRLQLEVEAETNPKAQRVLKMREDSNFLLTTILWGNVGINVLLTLLSSSVLAGVLAFLFSTVAITFLGEIIPQAYFSRNALRMASLLGPVLRLYQFILYPVAKPSARMLDAWLGKESPEFFREQVIRDMLLRHVEHHNSDVDDVEGIGALNFLDIDDLSAIEEGTDVDPTSIINLPSDIDLPRLPVFEATMEDPFLRSVQASGRKWVILADEEGEPQLILDSDGFLREVLFSSEPVDAYKYCHRPIILKSNKTNLGSVIRMMRRSKVGSHGVIENDVVLIWTSKPRIITGADLFDRLLHGIR